MNRNFISLLPALLCFIQITQGQDLNWNKTAQIGNFAHDLRCIIATDSNVFVGKSGPFDYGLNRSDSNVSNWKYLPLENEYWGILAMAEDSRHIFASTTYGGLLISANLGDSWDACNTSMLYDKIMHIVIKGQRLIVSSYHEPAYPFYETGFAIFISDDYGMNWGGPYLNNFINDLVVQGDFIYAACKDSIYRSENGRQWTSLNGSPNLVKDLYVDDSSIYAVKHTSIYRSDNSGLTWTQLNLEVDGLNTVYAKGQNIIAGGEYTYVSEDGGITWTVPDSTFKMKYVKSIMNFKGKIIAISSGIYESSDNGNTWHEKMDGMPDYPVYSLFLDDDEIFCGTLSGGIYSSRNNGASWETSYTGIDQKLNENSQIKSIVRSGNNLLAASFDTGIYQSATNGDNWTLIGPENYPVWHALFRIFKLETLAGNEVYAAGDNGLFYSNNSGSSWTQINTPYNFLTSLEISPGNLYIGSGIYSIWHSTNNGLTWDHESLEPTSYFVGCMLLKSGYLFVGTHEFLYRVDADDLSNTIICLNGFINNLITDGNLILAGTRGNGVFVSGDDGLSWDAINEGLSELNVYSLLKKGDTLYAGTQSGIWKTALPKALGIKEIKVSGFSIYPNPSSDLVNIVSCDETGFTSISLYDVRGKKISDYFTHGNRIQISMKNLNPGIYFMHIISKNSSTITKLVKE